jgi:hypothetical protein
VALEAIQAGDVAELNRLRVGHTFFFFFFFLKKIFGAFQSRSSSFLFHLNS